MIRLSTETSCQRQRILEHLRHRGPLTTVDARRELDVMHPAARVMELRARGYSIVTHWDWVDTPGGRHHVARYVLMPSNSNVAGAVK